MSRFSLLGAAFVVLLAVPLCAEPVALADLGPEGAEMYDDAGQVHLAVALTQPVPWRVRFADGPPRMIVEFSELNWSRAPTVKSSSVANVTTGKSGPDTSELVVYLREPLAVATAEMKSFEDGALLEVRLEPTTGAEFRDLLDAELASEVPPVDVEQGRMVVAIDPGHGGIDPGAEVGDLDEANLVLGFARRLKEELIRTGRFDVVLTREEDSFVSLDQRLTRARAADADVFLSLHADALASGGASGIVVYSLAPSAVGDAGARLTERHSDDDLIGGVDLSGAGDDVALALLDLARLDTAPRTEALSGALVGAFDAAGLALNSRPERLGAFSVLKSADIPSVLVELGFLSTEEDLERMTSEIWQAEASRAMRDALMLWEDEDRLLR